MNDTLNTYSFDLKTWRGETVQVEYRLPSLRKIGDYTDKLNSPVELVEYLAGEKEGWADKFTDESIFAMLSKVDEQMDPRIAAWVENQAAANKKLLGAKLKLLGRDEDPGTDSLVKSLLEQAGTSKKSQS